MAVGPETCPALSPVRGLRLGVTCAGIKKAQRKDLVLFELAPGTQVAGVFTRNAFCAAPVVLAKQHLEAGAPRYFLINTGNANAGTGQAGLVAAQRCCEALAAAVDIEPSQVLPFSTGVIGEPLPVERITAALPALLASCSEDNWRLAAEGILTTDTRPKGASRALRWQGEEIRITGIAKGSGMIKPDMATMLAFIATDAAIGAELLQEALLEAVDVSFNRISVDGDTSTNDACMLFATAQARASALESRDDPRYVDFVAALTQVCIELAQAIVRDGEGATKFVTVQVEGGRDSAECLQVAYCIAHSPLVKTALFASDPNWGRILAAVGRAGLVDLDVSRIDLYLDDVCIARQGSLAASYTEAQGQSVMQQEEITIRIVLGRGKAREVVWTTDLSHDYVSINADYRS